MRSSITAIIVDDELYSREELKYLLKEYPFFRIVDEAESGDAALLKALQLQPDVVFLDVEMPRMNGMTAAKALVELKKSPLIVFTTAYPQFAAEAFRYHAIDYLLKPYDEEQLQETVARIMNALVGTPDKHFAGKLAIEWDGDISYVEPKDILYMYRDDKLTKLILKNGELETKMALKELENRLLAYHFFRFHKSFLVNLEYVTRLTPWFNGAYQLQIEGRPEMLSVSRNYVKALRQRLEL